MNFFKNYEPKTNDRSPFLEFDRKAWAGLAEKTAIFLCEADLGGLKGLGEPLDLLEVQEIYLPLSRLLHLHFVAAKQLHNVTTNFLGDTVAKRTPFVIGIAGSVAVGKSTTARLLQKLLSLLPGNLQVDLVTTDGFLYPNAHLESLNLLHRKGFPESYDRKALLRFVSAIKSGAKEVCAPKYSHLIYDIVPREKVVVVSPDILILEGLNVLAPARLDAGGRSGLAVSDFFDFSIYLDANFSNIKSWYISRFQALRDGAFKDPNSYFHRYASLSEGEAVSFASHIWETINKPNLLQNVAPTRSRARLVLVKDSSHLVRKVLLRKI